MHCGSSDCLLSPPPVLEKIRSAVGSAQLLMSQKVQQFYRLCQQNMVSAGQRCHGLESRGSRTLNWWRRTFVMLWGRAGQKPPQQPAG